jgi:hypothetical protein
VTSFLLFLCVSNESCAAEASGREIPLQRKIVYSTIQRYSGSKNGGAKVVVNEAKESCENSNIDEEGFDISLIRETLRMSPDERLNWHQELVRVIEDLRHAIKL